ncbi:hypothetical protein CSPB12327_04345 [Campylobacter sp. RM12327]|uniref:hypothetical protein n=1 Tax=Campylobacter sputorum TaxID=206 RepID=UPI000B771064|nr:MULTISPECIES: hypothetical protein [Campylobacter]ASM39285.1 hypothetical protein CSPB_0008 [Campylobacter sputorum]MBE7358453.1 hypothetical protein [Campylobacter sp. RM11302]MBF6669372.1 hypothetical protein [Campylobacter sp. RM12327]MBF6674640.1 hypothetical protein [Campylobacter sp. RM13538]MBF6676148.1 hypothetical protein [Campylobacter sp. RM12321]
MFLKFKFITFFRNLLVYHPHSLEFRAKIFTAMLYFKKEITQGDIHTLNDIAAQIYGEKNPRIEILKNVIKEYLTKIKNDKSFVIDSLLLDIDKELKNHKRYAKKIDFSHLRMLISMDEDEALLQQRVYEFFLSEVKIYI